MTFLMNQYWYHPPKKEIHHKQISRLCKLINIPWYCWCASGLCWAWRLCRRAAFLCSPAAPSASWAPGKAATWCVTSDPAHQLLERRRHGVLRVIQLFPLPHQLLERRRHGALQVIQLLPSSPWAPGKAATWWVTSHPVTLYGRNKCDAVPSLERRHKIRSIFDLKYILIAKAIILIHSISPSLVQYLLGGFLEYLYSFGRYWGKTRGALNRPPVRRRLKK